MTEVLEGGGGVINGWHFQVYSLIETSFVKCCALNIRISMFALEDKLPRRERKTAACIKSYWTEYLEFWIHIWLFYGINQCVTEPVFWHPLFCFCEVLVLQLIRKISEFLFSAMYVFSFVFPMFVIWDERLYYISCMNFHIFETKLLPNMIQELILHWGFWFVCHSVYAIFYNIDADVCLSYVVFFITLNIM